MKKILFLFLLAGAMLSVSAQTTTTRTTTTTHRYYRYYYYPATNIYYDEASVNYWYWDNASSQWIMAQTLPSNIAVVQTRRYPVNYNGNDPWKNNATDMKKFKVKKNGKIKMKPQRY